MGDNDLVVVHTYSSQVEADLAQSALEAAGIEVMLRADSVGQMYPTDAGIGYNIVVRAEDARVAREILELPAEIESES